MMEKVGIGQIKVSKGSGILCAYGLGSCIGLFLYEPLEKVGGLAHIMLPGSAPENLAFSRTKYAENAIHVMLQEMTETGADLRQMGAILVGGASMFRETCGDGRVSIGEKNTEAVRQILKRLMIPVRAEETGGDYGRTIEAHIETGRVVVKSFRYGVKEFLWSR